MRGLSALAGNPVAAGMYGETPGPFLSATQRPEDNNAGLHDEGGDAATLAARFGGDLEGLCPTPTSPGPLAVAVSGGADSLALLLLANAAFPGAVVAASVDHGLRPEAADEARFVAAICAEIGVRHTILTLKMAPGGSLQARARTERYAALGRWAREMRAVSIATGHHRDDQAETLLMRAARGAGLGGLAAVRPSALMHCGGASFRVVRPLLGWSRVELRDVVGHAGLTPVLDPANDSLLFDRTRARRLLAATPWLDPARLAATAAHLAEAGEALEWAARELTANRIARQADGSLALAAAELPAEFQRRLLVDALRMLGEHSDHPGPKLARLLATLRAGRTGTIGRVKASGGGGAWRLSPAPPRQRN